MYRRPEKMTNFEDVGEFHDKFGLHSATSTPDGEGPQEVTPELRSFRANFLLEEISEYIEAIGGKVVISDIVVAGARTITVTVPDGASVDHAKAFDALMDLTYIAMGTAHLEGYPWQKGWDLVQKANMSKVRAQPDGSDSLRGSSFDVVKPEGWRPPNVEALLTLYGYVTALNDPEQELCANCDLERRDHHSEVDHEFKQEAKRR